MFDRFGRTFQPVDIGSDAWSGKYEKRRFIFSNKFQGVGAVDGEVALVHFEIIRNAPGRS